jgi:hypothetical protein
VKVSGKQSNRLAEISDSIPNRRDIQDSKSVPTSSPVGQNEPSVPIGSHTQPSEPRGDKNRIINMAAKRAVCAGLGKERGEAVRLLWAKNREIWERNREHG